MANATIRDLVVGINPGMQDIMSHLIKKSSFLKVAMAIPANGKIEHKYRKETAVPEFTVGSLNQSIVGTKITRSIETVALSAIDAKEEVNFRIAENWNGGVKQYFADNLLSYIEGWSQAAMKQVIYGTNSTFGNATGFIGLHQLAKMYGNVTGMGGATGSRSSLFVVKFDPAACGVLFNPVDVAEGNLLRIEPILDGKKYPRTVNETAGTREDVYGVNYLSMLSFLSSTQYDVAAVTQIQDATDDKPTASAIDTAIEQVRGDADGSTFIFANRTVRRLMKELKNSKFELGAMDMNYDTRIDYWDGIPIATEDNILNTETTVLD